MMKKFLVTYHAPVNAMEQTINVPPEQMAKGMELWMHWAQRCGEKLLDMGSPLINGQSLHPDGTIQKSTKQVCGYSIVQAENMEEALGLMAGHPHTSGWSQEASIEVHEQMLLPGM